MEPLLRKGFNFLIRNLFSPTFNPLSSEKDKRYPGKHFLRKPFIFTVLCEGKESYSQACSATWEVGKNLSLEWEFCPLPGLICFVSNYQFVKYLC